MKDKSRPAPLESQPSSSLSPLHPPSMVNYDYALFVYSSRDVVQLYSIKDKG